VSTVSHELRTPLTSIQGSLRLLDGGAVDKLEPAVKNLVDVAYRSSDHLIRRINDILDIDKLEAGKLQFHIRPLDPVARVEQAFAATQDCGRLYGVRFAGLEAPAAAKVLGDMDRLTQVVTNLLSNAAKFSPKGTTVDIEIREAEGAVRVSIRGHGSGVPEEPRKTFAQADASDTRQKGGTGLGLSISKAIVERLGGRIGFEIRTREGTTFNFDLSVAPAAA
jgi:signal transduction histidine kinase